MVQKLHEIYFQEIIQKMIKNDFYEFMIEAWWPFYSIHMIYLLNYFCLVKFKNLWIMIFIVNGIIPYLDKKFSMDMHNPKKEKEKDLEKR